MNHVFAALAASVIVLLVLLALSLNSSQEFMTVNEDESYVITLYEGYRVSDVKKTFAGNINKPSYMKLIFPFNLKSYTINTPKIPKGKTLHIKIMSLYEGSNIASSVATGVGTDPYKEPEYTRTASPTKYTILEDLYITDQLNTVKELTIPVKRVMLFISLA